MGVKIADKLEQFNNGTYYLVDSSAVEYVDKDGVTKSVKDALDNAPTDESTHKTTIYENHIDMGKYILLAKITNANYTNNIIKFSCPNYKGSMDVGFKYEDDMNIYKFELHFNTGSRRENNSYGVTLKQHGLGLYSYPLDNPKNTEPRIEESIRLYWDYSKGEIYVFLVDMMTAIPHCVLEYTGSGTLLRDNTFVMDDLYNRREGLNGTWEDSKWKSIPYNKLEVPPIHELGGDGGSAEGATTFVTLSDIGLTAEASFQDVVDALPKGGSALLGVKDFTNYQTIFPYEEGNDQFARVHIVKGLDDGSCVYARWFRKDGVKEAIAKFNINDNKFNGWQRIQISGCEYHSINQLNKMRGTSLELVKGEDNTQMIMDALGVGDSFLSLFHNDSSMDRFGIPTSVGDRITRLHIERILDANGSSSYCLATAIMNTGVVLNRNNYGGTLSAWIKTPSDDRVTTLETQVSELFQSVSSGKTLVANAITGKGVSTATNATFATMATNISKIKGYKEETKSQYVPMSNATTMVVRFSANVLGITEVIPPSDDSYITSEEMFRIEGGDVYVRVSGEGTWAITALIEA